MTACPRHLPRRDPRPRHLQQLGSPRRRLLQPAEAVTAAGLPPRARARAREARAVTSKGGRVPGVINAGTRTSVGRLNPRAAAAVLNTGVPAVAVAPPPPQRNPCPMTGSATGAVTPISTGAKAASVAARRNRKR